jgi:D-amino-acid dehydrogenase
MNYLDASRQVTVLGAGMVGVSCALALQAKGWRVTLIDKRGPGEETSFGNAGVLSRSSLLPFNRPGLWRALPRMLLTSSPALRLRASGLMQWPWLFQFLWHAKASSFELSTVALDALIQLSMATHSTWRKQAQVENLFHDKGWLWLYSNPEAFASSAVTRGILQDFSVNMEVLTTQSLTDLEPHIAPNFSHALWIKDAISVSNPGALVRAYAQQFMRAGGEFQTDEVLAVTQQSSAWLCHTASGRVRSTPKLVVAMGPWSDALLTASHLSKPKRIPLGFERGYHRHFKSVDGIELGRPVYDISGAYVLSPMQNDRGEPIMRLSTGVELAAQHAGFNAQQLEDAEKAARKAFPLKEPIARSDWLGARPTTPDSRPVIGEMPGCPGLWLAYGHQHIGLSTGSGTGVLLSELMSSEPTSIDPSPFSPARF